ncbi:hypothetical protein BS78_02G073300 [Paspalum vaginatum]|nr:hypothetical protein BS78_02G073300 [Paspalum vaginatum]
MRDLACFGESSVQIADASSSSSSSSGAAGRGKGGGGVRGPAARGRVTCVYHARLASRPCAVSVTWARAGGLVAGQAAALGVVAADRASGERLCAARVRPWLFAGRRGSRTLDVAGGGAGRVGVFWDLSGARFGAGPEPLGGFYVAVVCGAEMALLLGDMRGEAFRRTGAGAGGRPAGDALLVARTEHVVGSKVFAATAQLCHGGRRHDVAIACDTAGDDPCLEIRVDGRPAMLVKRLPWKFRGNQTVLVDGLPVEVFWDVHGWLFGGAMASDAVFMFQTCKAAREKPMPWAYSQIFGEPQVQGQDFSLVIHASKVE